MRPERAEKSLAEMADAAAFIRGVTEQATFAAFEDDRLLRQAVERNFEIIGEAMTRLLRDAPALAERVTEARAIVAFRNLLIHGYDVIDRREVWRVIVQDLPRFLEEIRTLQRELKS